MIPSLATYRGSKPNRSHAALTDELMGNSFSSMAMVTFAPSAISFSVLDNPPRVGSRSICTSGTPASRLETIWVSAAVSLWIEVSKPKLSRYFRGRSRLRSC